MTSPFGENEVVIESFRGTEGLSEIFDFRIEALSETENLNFDKAIGEKFSVTINAAGGADRQFNGLLVEANWGGVKGGLHRYELVLRPWLWLLSFSTDCRIFAEKNVPDIIREIFRDSGFTDFRFTLTESYPTLEYCVQYRETSLDFVLRLMEENGIYYFFEHTKEKHTLVLADARSSHKPCPGLAKVPFWPLEGDSRRDRQTLEDWRAHRRLRTGTFSLTDYDPLQPNAELDADAEGDGPKPKPLEKYDYPGRYIDREEGRRLARVWMQAEHAEDRRRQARGTAVSLLPGGLVTLEKHPTAAENDEYLVVRCQHRYETARFRSTGGAIAGGGDPEYAGIFDLQPASRPYRPPEVTPKPRVSGPQTARVICRDGEEIDVDEHGRITVRFHWDRKNDVSRRVRVAQVWAGKGWGGVFIPRRDQEVVVEFLEGDPDQPLVVGAVYNGENTPPYDLPAEKNIAGWKTQSTKGGGGNNEFTFDDTAGNEVIHTFAEKDLKTEVSNVASYSYGAELSQPRSGAALFTEVEKGDEKRVIKQGDRKTNLEMGSDILDAAQKITMTANVEIKLQVGASKITIDQKGIKLDAPMIEINGAALVKVNAPMTKIDGSATLMLTGGIVKIN